MIDLSKRPAGCLESDSGPDSSTGGFLEPDSGLAGQSGRGKQGWQGQGRQGGIGQAGADGVGLGAGVSNDAGRADGAGGWLGGGWCGRARGGMGGPLGASGGRGVGMDRGGMGGRLGALRALPGRCMQCPGGGSAHHAGIKKPPSGGLAVGKGGISRLQAYAIRLSLYNVRLRYRLGKHCDKTL